MSFARNISNVGLLQKTNRSYSSQGFVFLCFRNIGVLTTVIWGEVGLNFGNLELAKVQHQGFKLIFFQKGGRCEKSYEMWKLSEEKNANSNRQHYIYPVIASKLPSITVLSCCSQPLPSTIPRIHIYFSFSIQKL